MKNVGFQMNSRFIGSADQGVKLSLAESEQEKLRIYRLRYQVYVEEMGRQLSMADHENRMVYDEFDEAGYTVYAQAGSEIIGTIRVNAGTLEEYSSDLVSMFCMNIFQGFDNKQKFCFTSKYVIASAYRRSSVAYMLVAWSYEFWRNRGEAHFNFMGCNPSMVPLYERLGFRRFADNVDIPEYGCMTPLVLVLEDEKHLRAVGSPFFRKARKFRNDPAAANWFIQEFSTVARFVNSRLVSEDDLWSILQAKLGRSPRKAVPVLKGLTEKEAKQFVHIGVIHPYKEGERVLVPGDFCHEMNILLTGILEVSNPAISHPLDTYRVKPGDLCGRVALLETGEQTVQAVALTEVELMIISGMAFEAFCRSHPVIAHKIMRNLGCGISTETRRPAAR